MQSLILVSYKIIKFHIFPNNVHCFIVSIYLLQWNCTEKKVIFLEYSWHTKQVVVPQNDKIKSLSEYDELNKKIKKYIYIKISIE
jgi:hypothetical protein